MEKALKEQENTKINLYKINFGKGVKSVALSNCVYFDNQNKTLPVGMDKDTKMIVDISNTDVQLNSKKTIRVGMLENEKSDASKLIIKTVNVLEYTIKNEESERK